jgi:hypothetical protein
METAPPPRRDSDRGPARKLAGRRTSISFSTLVRYLTTRPRLMLSHALAQARTDALLISYQRSGNHLVRFIIEFVSGRPTLGAVVNPKDVPICENTFEDVQPLAHVDTKAKPICLKCHAVPPSIGRSKRIFILRDWRSAICSHITKMKKFENRIDSLVEIECERYLKIVRAISEGDLVVFFEDLLDKREGTLQALFDYLEISQSENRDRFFENVDELYRISASGKYKSWGGYVSKGESDFYATKHAEVVEKISQVLPRMLREERFAGLSAIEDYCPETLRIHFGGDIAP